MNNDSAGYNCVAKQEKGILKNAHYFFSFLGGGTVENIACPAHILVIAERWNTNLILRALYKTKTIVINII